MKMRRFAECQLLFTTAKTQKLSLLPPAPRPQTRNIWLSLCGIPKIVCGHEKRATLQWSEGGRARKKENSFSAVRFYYSRHLFGDGGGGNGRRCSVAAAIKMLGAVLIKLERRKSSVH